MNNLYQVDLNITVAHVINTSPLVKCRFKNAIKNNLASTAICHSLVTIICWFPCVSFVIFTGFVNLIEFKVIKINTVNANFIWNKFTRFTYFIKREYYFNLIYFFYFRLHQRNKIHLFFWSHYVNISIIVFHLESVRHSQKNHLYKNGENTNQVTAINYSTDTRFHVAENQYFILEYFQMQGF